jgi:uncharacterized protein YgfB (UPF0149 family)
MERVAMPRMKHRELLKGLVRLHILHHASEAEFYGQWMIQELARHGYALSPGTLYAMLHGLECRGYLNQEETEWPHIPTALPRDGAGAGRSTGLPKFRSVNSLVSC